MPLIHLPNSSLFFAHIPKTGGTSFKDYLLKRFDRVSLVDVKGQSSGKGFISPVSHLAARDLIELLPPDTACFAIVRNPLNRLKSEYRFQSKVSRMSMFGFSMWLRVVLHATKLEPRLYQNHIRPQTDMIPDGSENFKFESGFDALIERVNTLTQTTRPDLTVQHLNRKRPTQAVNLSIDADDVALIQEFYARDYADLGYPLPVADSSARNRFRFLTTAVAKGLAHLLVVKQRRDWIR